MIRSRKIDRRNWHMEKLKHDYPSTLWAKNRVFFILYEPDVVKPTKE